MLLFDISTEVVFVLFYNYDPTFCQSVHTSRILMRIVFFPTLCENL